MDKRVYNFSPGPATLPLSVLQEAQRDLLSLPGLGVSALEISHRCPWFDKVLEKTEANLRTLLKLPAEYKVLFMQGGSRLQFAMVPMNLSPAGQSADFIVTGAWSKMALDEAQKLAADPDAPMSWVRAEHPGLARALIQALHANAADDLAADARHGDLPGPGELDDLGERGAGGAISP